MKLSIINEIGHWDLAPGDYPNSMLKTKKNKSKRHSFLLHPSDRERFLKWSKPAKPNEEYMKLRMVVEYRLTGDWPAEKPYLGRKAWSMQPTTSTTKPNDVRIDDPEDEPELYGGLEEGEWEDVEPVDTIPVVLSYGMFNVFKRYMEGHQDPLFSVLKRRGNSVDWKGVDVSPEELDRLATVAEHILLYSEDDGEIRTAKALQDQLEKLL